jgi:hypothetical protein
MSRLADDIAHRVRLALADDGHPHPAWSTGEQLFVALVLDDTEYLDAEQWTREQAVQRLAGEIYGDDADAEAWIRDVRTALAEDFLQAYRRARTGAPLEGG